MLNLNLNKQQHKDIQDCFDSALQKTQNKNDEGDVYYMFIDLLDNIGWVKELMDQNRKNPDYRFVLQPHLFDIAQPLKNFAKGQAVNQ
jgi:hypothetical protein|tara:strand:+ start:684 stop:947 length:264 start_codon:yes stop_codon:yes gene_type:complete